MSAECPIPEVAALLDQLVGGSYNRFGPARDRRGSVAGPPQSTAATCRRGKVAPGHVQRFNRSSRALALWGRWEKGCARLLGPRNWRAVPWNSKLPKHPCRL